MTPVNSLGELIGLESIAAFTNPEDWWSNQEIITQALSKYLASQKTEHWLGILDAADVWCAPVLTLPELVEHDGFAQLEMMQETVRGDADEIKIKTTRSPMRLDGETLKSRKGAPRVGEDTEKIRKEFLGGK
jgi:CoA:oxalate CoA-transferase